MFDGVDCGGFALARGWCVDGDALDAHGVAPGDDSRYLGEFDSVAGPQSVAAKHVAGGDGQAGDWSAGDELPCADGYDAVGVDVAAEAACVVAPVYPLAQLGIAEWHQRDCGDWLLDGLEPGGFSGSQRGRYSEGSVPLVPVEDVARRREA